MKIIALDVGRSRIGVALSDPDHLLALPLTTIERTAEPEDIAAILDLVDENEADEIVVGMPLSLSGQVGPQAREVVAFVKSLSAAADVPVVTLDERYSTVEAERLLREAGHKPSKSRARVDAVAATVVLQSYLDSRRAAPRP